MNERIKELADYAYSYASEQAVEFTPEFMGYYDKKFAELLVKECIRVSESHANDLESKPTDPLLEMYDNGIVNGIYEATEAIKEHFGVE